MKTALSPKLPPSEATRSRPSEAAAPAPAPKASSPAPSARAESVFETRSGGGLKLPDVGGWWDRHVERPFVMGRDGFVAVDPAGKIVGGQPPSVRVREHNFIKSPLDP